MEMTGALQINVTQGERDAIAAFFGTRLRCDGYQGRNSEDMLEGARTLLSLMGVSQEKAERLLGQRK